MSVISLDNISKTYRSYARPWDRLKEAITQRAHHHEHQVLKPLDLEIGMGHVVGLVGANGAGKSTLLKIIAGTLQPSAGNVTVNGQVAALLELGAGFHPDMSGRENVYLGAAVAGLSREKIESRYEEIVSFSGLAEAMDRPVKTFSSGMSARLAFAVAMAVEPEILILDETLSVGDGAFARRSFDRIIDFKNAGKTILFCSHSMYQVEAICDRVLWLEKGHVMQDGEPAKVVSAYSEFLSKQSAPPTSKNQPANSVPIQSLEHQTQARLLDVKASAEGRSSKRLVLETGLSDLTVTVRFQGAPDLEIPSLGIVIVGGNGWAVASSSSLDDGLRFSRTEGDDYLASITFPRLALLKGNYWVNAFLLCEQGIHLYDRAERVAEFEVVQNCRELGIVTLPRTWKNLTNK